MSIGGINIALSGALAQTQRLAVSAGNVANLRSTGAIPAADGTVQPGQSQPYQPQTASQTSVAGPGGQGQGTRVVARPTTPAYLPEYQPDSPDANADGLVAAPNVDIVGESVGQMTALRAFQANLATIRTQDEMERSAIDTLA
ncbi:flagellar basal body rod protein FlgC [Niveispirillum fermenti]|uniref:flagellar basal body rod protein FlgC n=1 Tax=Niveispirillum fermenti TaxID=1233113 RepID=UPI003A89D42D